MPIFVRVRESCFVLELVRADVEIKLARETRIEQPVVRQDTRDGREDLALAKRRRFVVFVTVYMLSLN